MRTCQVPNIALHDDTNGAKAEGLQQAASPWAQQCSQQDVGLPLFTSESFKQKAAEMKWSEGENVTAPASTRLRLLTLALTFVESCGHVAGGRAQQHPEDHGARHEGASVGRRQEAQTGQDCGGRADSHQGTQADSTH